MNAAAVTLADLGLLLGIDKSSVSLALRGSPKIGAATRKRVLEAAERYGYRPNLAARQLQQGAHALSLIGVYLPDSLISLLGPTAMRTLQSLARLATERGMLFQLLVSSAIPAEGSALRPDVALIWGDMPLAEAAAIMASHARALVLDPNHPSFEGFTGPALRMDNAGAGAALARLVHQRGARRLLFVTVDPRHLGHRARASGRARRGPRSIRAPSSSTAIWTRSTTQRLMAFCARGGDGAIICSNDGGGIRLWRRLQRLRLDIPERVRLASVDGDDYALAVGLTSAVFDHERLAQAAIAAVIAPERAGAAPDIPFPLHIGESV